MQHSCTTHSLFFIHFCLNLQQPVVLRQPLGLGDRPHFDVVACPAGGEVGEPVVFGFAAAPKVMLMDAQLLYQRLEGQGWVGANLRSQAQI